MDGLRLSALALHAVADRDRAWLLSRLPDAQRGPLAELLTELRRTGIPADPGLITQLVHEREAMNEGARGGQPSPGLLQAAAEDVWKQLRGEPDAVAARILRRNRWPWLDDLMALCGPGRARNIEALIRTLDPAPALEQALVQELEARLQARQASPGRRSTVKWQFFRRGGSAR